MHKSRSSFSFAIVIALVCSLSLACGKKYYFAAGFEGGTYYRIGLALNEIATHTFQVYVTTGSRENIEYVRTQKADLGITQFDVWNKISEADSDLEDQVKILFPMHAEEVHIIANKKIKSVAALKGKQVSVGPANSGMAETAATLFKQLKLSNVKIQNDSTKKGIEKLLAGKIDAVLVVAGFPVPILSELDVSRNETIHMLGLPSGAIEALSTTPSPYREVRIEGGTYAWQSGAINTIAVDSVCIARAGLSNERMTTLVRDIFSKKAKLAGYHPKWKQLDMSRTRRLLARKRDLFHPGVIAELGQP